MKKWYSLILSLLVFVLFSSLVGAAGNCELDKDVHHPEETGAFSCSCTLPNEENVAGYMVWRNGTNHVIQNISTNSGTCRTDFFFSFYTFPVGTEDVGNVTFENIGAGWAGGDDVVSDDWNVTGVHPSDCILNSFKSSEANPGDNAIVQATVRDGNSNNTLLGANCYMYVLDTNKNPVYFHTEHGHHHERSTIDGHILFQRELTESIWVTNQSLLLEMECWCEDSTLEWDTLPIIMDAESAPICHYENGTITGFKSCKSVVQFQLGEVDNRNYGISFGLAFVVIGVLFFLILLSKIINGDEWFHKTIKLLIVLLSIWVIVISGSLGVSYANSVGASNATITTAQVFYKLTIIFAWVFTFLLLLYYVYEVLMAFRIEQTKKKDDLLGK